MPIVGRKYHMACHGVFRLEDGIGVIDWNDQLCRKLKFALVE